MANVKRANALGITKAGTGISDVPDAPTIGTATGGQSAATVTFTAATTGGTATSFTATSSPGSVTGTASSSPITVSGLTNGTAYTFTVTATNSTGTSPASSASNSVTPVNLGDMEAIAMVEVGSAGAATISFTSIPATYKHLQVRAIVRDTGASYGYNVRLRFNGDSGSNYTRHQLESNGSSASASGSSSAETSIPIAMTTGGTNSSGTFASFICDVLDYANTNKNKTARCLLGYDDNGSGYVNLRSGSYMQNTITAISSMTLESTGTLFAQYSTFALYGIKG